MIGSGSVLVTVGTTGFDELIAAMCLHHFTESRVIV